MIMNFREKKPVIADSCFIAASACIIGDVTLHERVGVWYGSVIRGDRDHIIIHADTNIQDNCTLHTDPDHILNIGSRVSVGHNAVLHGCTIEDEVLIGMGAVILNGAHVHTHCIVGANALVMENQVIPAGSIVVGSPARVVKTISKEQIQHIQKNAEHYIQLATVYKEMEARLDE